MTAPAQPCCTPKEKHAANHAISSPKVHIHLHTKNLAASAAFYRVFFGEKPVKEKDGYVKYLPSWAPVNLALSAHDASEPGPALSHFGIQLPSPEAVQVHLHRVKAAGLPVREEMGVNCCHANQDKFWVKDPAGIEWEVYYLNFDLEADAAQKPASACCTK
jgi:lactoylglutathione lyase